MLYDRLTFTTTMLALVLANAMILGCNRENTQDNLRSSASKDISDDTVATGAASTALASDDPRRSYRRYNISRHEIDDPKFLVTSLAVGLKNFISSKSIILTYNIPIDADYVEIIRCNANANIPTGTSTVALQDIGLRPDATEIMRTNDLFRSAEEQDNCEIISLGSMTSTYQDSFAPSGEYIYLTRSCVASQRLLDQENLTKRNCSRQISVSNAISHTNKRQQLENEALQKMSVFEAKIDNSFWNLRVIAEDMIAEAERCETREAQRAVDTKIKEAWITIVATGADIALELVSYGKTAPLQILSHYLIPIRKTGTGNVKLSPSRLVDTFGMLAAMGGLSFRDTFINLLASSEDMPRACARLQSLQFVMQGHISTINHDFYGLSYFAEAAQIAAQGQNISDGENLPAANSGFDFGGLGF